jgi:hypothetical protein
MHLRRHESALGRWHTITEISDAPPVKLHPRLGAVAALAAAGAAIAAPELWIDDSAGRLGRVDVATGSVVVVGTMNVVMWDIAFDPLGNLFGVGNGNTLYRINPTNAATTFVGNLGATVNSLVFAADGTLYGASNALFRINPSTGAATRIGNGGIAYNSSGDLAFVGGNLLLSSSLPSADTLVRLNPATGVASSVGAMGIAQAYGLATSNNINLFGVSGTNIYTVNPATGAATAPINYGGRGLDVAFGTTFITEVPEPGTVATMLVGLGVVGWLAHRRRRID